MNVTVNEMLERLQDEANAGRGEYEVRIAFQPAYPLRAEVDNIVASDDMLSDDDTDERDNSEHFLWIACSAGPRHYDENPYAPSAAWSEM